MYKGIAFCDGCGQALQGKDWITGQCRDCEAKAKRPLRQTAKKGYKRGPGPGG